MTTTFPLPELNTLPADIQATIIKVQEKAGFVPNVFLMLARRPDEFRAFIAYHDALMLRKGGLSKGEKEMIIVATSGLNHCLYCVVAHGAILRIYEKSPHIADQIAINHRKAPLSPRQHAMLDYALKVANHSDTVNQSDFDALTAHGFDMEDVWDIGNITALFALSNRMANVTGLMPNDEFYSLGRSVKA
jgi:uncharacterized peroxidase-related enzyme